MEVDCAALRHNFRQVRQLIGPAVGILAVVKADAYGHGLIPAAQAFAEAGATSFGVAEVEEGIRLRQAGITGQIIVLLGIDRQGLRRPWPTILPRWSIPLKHWKLLPHKRKRVVAGRGCS